MLPLPLDLDWIAVVTPGLLELPFGRRNEGIRSAQAIAQGLYLEGWGWLDWCRLGLDLNRDGW